MDPMLLNTLLTALFSVAASSGFWAFMQKKLDKNDIRTKLMVGLAHDRIVYLGMKFIERGWIYQDEYENLYDYIWVPYEKMGGNGSAAKVMGHVKELPCRQPPTHFGFHKEDVNNDS